MTELVTNVTVPISVTDPEVGRLVSQHVLSDPSLLHTDLVAYRCACAGVTTARPPNTTGDVCANCGGMAVRTGTCTTCTECGTTGGCG